MKLLHVSRVTKKEMLVLEDEDGEEYQVQIVSARSSWSGGSPADLEVELVLPYPYTVDFNAGES